MLNTQAKQEVNAEVHVVVENGTQNGGFAKRWSDTLTSLGYGRLGDGYIDAPMGVKGRVPQTKVLCFGANTETAQAIATTLGVASTAVDTKTARPGETPPRTDILVILGDDAHEPDANVKSGTG